MAKKGKSNPKGQQIREFTKKSAGNIPKDVKKQLK